MIKEELTPAELAFVDSRIRIRRTPSRAIVIDVQRRVYLRECGLAAHVNGYVGEVSEDELNTLSSRVSPGDMIGKDGVDANITTPLIRLLAARQRSFVQRRLPEDEDKDKEAIPGKHLQLAIDLDLQAVAELTMENRRGRRRCARSAEWALPWSAARRSIRICFLPAASAPRTEGSRG